MGPITLNPPASVHAGALALSISRSLGGYESRWKIEFGFEYFTGNHERRHLEEGISISFACTVYMD